MRSVLAAVVSALLCFPVLAQEITVGIYKDVRSLNIDCIATTLKEEGMASVIIGKKDCQDIEKLKGLDVIYFPNGYHVYRFLDEWRGPRQNVGRKTVTDFVAHGKGVLAGGFRSGYPRTANRPLFPEVGCAHNKPDGSFLFAHGKHSILKGFSGPLCCEFRDHVVLKKGPLGQVFLVDVDGLPVGIAGEVLNGRYAMLGMFIAISKELKVLPGDLRTLFVNSIRWLAGAKRLKGEELARSRREAELHFLRRDKILNYTIEERGPDRTAGLIPRAKYMIEVPLDSLRYQLLQQAEWLTGRDHSRALAAAEHVAKYLGRLETNDQRIREETIARIKSADRDALLDDDPKPFEEKLPERLLTQKEREAAAKAAGRVISALRPKVMAAKATRDRQARAKDIANVPALLKQCESSQVKVRRRAALELGRIGDARATPVLLRLLRDIDEKARTNAIQSLGWMQAKEALPELATLVKSGDKWARRRAVQTLGQIGDRSATQLLVSLISHPDPRTAENAILALGWLGDPAAVLPLLGVLQASRPLALASADQIHKQKELRAFDEKDRLAAAIRALGHLGDERALPVLEKLAAMADDTKRHRFARYLGVKEYGEIAIKEIKAGGRREAGVQQPEYLSLNRHFHGMREQFNFFVGRPGMPLHYPQFEGRRGALLDYIWCVGATGLLKGWYDLRLEPPARTAFLNGMTERGLKWLPDLPMIPSSHLEKKFHKPGGEKALFDYRDVPAFAGFWSEEVYPSAREEPELIQRFLAEKYGPDFRQELGLQPDQKIEVPAREDRPAQKKLWAEYLDYASRTLIEDWREAQEWMHGLRKGCAFTYTVSAPSRMSDSIGVYARAGQVIHVNGAETYNSQGPDNAFMMDLVRDGERRPVICEFYNWYSPSVAHAERGYALHLMHGECFFNFSLSQVFKHPGDWLWLWNKERWDALKRVFLKARKVSPYLGGTSSVANVALIYSDRTSVLHYGQSRDWLGTTIAYCHRYFQHQEALWETLVQSHIPVDAIWAETLTAEKLVRYRFLVLSDAKSLTTGEENVLREWVRNGGVLLATGTTTLFNEWGEPRSNYGLADVFGVSYKGHVVETDPEAIDSYRMRDAAHSCEKIVKEGFDPREIRHYVHRELKPQKSLRKFQMLRESPFLPGLSRETEFEYDVPLGRDRIDATTAEVLARWKGGDPALTLNRFGKGHCLFSTEIYPGLCHRASGWENYPIRKEFWPGKRELVASMVRGGLTRHDQELPAEAADCAEMVELTIRAQPEKRRWMVHLLNYDPNIERVKGSRITVRPPKTDELKIFYPADGQKVQFSRDGNAVSFRVREFGVHEMVVVAF